MPSGITHQLVAEEAEKLLPEGLQHIIKKAPDEYYLGCQGPDMFFFYRIGNKSEYNIGKYLHRYSVAETFRLFARVLAGEQNPRFPALSEDDRTRVFAYILGYITHYATDSTFHPFVYNFMEREDCPKRIHQLIENDWDVYFLRKFRGREAEKFRCAFKVKEIAENGAVARLYACLAEELGREEVKRGKFNAGLKNFWKYLTFFHGKCYSSQRHWEKLEHFFRAKPFLSCLYPRKEPEREYLANEDFLQLSEGKGGNVDELFDNAVKESARLASLFVECVRKGEPLPEADFNKSFLTGKPVE